MHPDLNISIEAIEEVVHLMTDEGIQYSFPPSVLRHLIFFPVSDLHEVRNVVLKIFVHAGKHREGRVNAGVHKCTPLLY